MTSRELIAAEADNTDRIVLYREGIFWKAYERSAFAVCTQIRPFKPTKRSLKTLGGEELISVGFPMASERTVLGSLTLLDRKPDRLVSASLRPIVAEEFEAWKSSVPTTPPRIRTTVAGNGTLPHICPDAAESATSGIYDGVPDFRERDPLTEPVGDTMRAYLATARDVVERVRAFDLASSTPMECMMFILELQKTLSACGDNGTIR